MRILKLFLFVSILANLQFGCSSDDNSQPFNSTITIDSIVYEPKQISFYTINSSIEKSVVFILKKNLNTPMDLDEMVFRIDYPLTQSDASGTYQLNGYQAVGNYTKGSTSYNFFNGSFLIEDLGNEKYNITFQNVKGNPGNGSTEVITVLGNLNGTFQFNN